MMISKIFSAEPRKLVPKWIIGTILFLASIGFVNALYLTVKKFTGSALKCYFFGGCDAVNASPYSVLFGIPLSLYGTIFYLLIILFAVGYLIYEKPRAFKALMVLGAMGFLLSGYFIFIQGFVIGAFCFYCVVSAVVSTLYFGLLVFGWQKYFKEIFPPVGYNKIIGINQ